MKNEALYKNLELGDSIRISIPFEDGGSRFRNVTVEISAKVDGNSNEHGDIFFRTSPVVLHRDAPGGNIDDWFLSMHGDGQCHIWYVCGTDERDKKIYDKIKNVKVEIVRKWNSK